MATSDADDSVITDVKPATHATSNAMSSLLRGMSSITNAANCNRIVIRMSDVTPDLTLHFIKIKEVANVHIASELTTAENRFRFLPDCDA